MMGPLQTLESAYNWFIDFINGNNATAAVFGDNFSETSDPFFVYKLIVGIVSVIFFILTIFFLNKANALWRIKQWWHAFSQPKFIPPTRQINLLNEWQIIEGRVNKGDEANIKLAIIEADRLFDDLLKKIGYFGDDMGARLKQISREQIPNIDDIWNAHKIRNQIAHQANYHVSQSDAKRAVLAYEKAFKQLDVL